MQNTAKVTKAQRATLVRIWTERTAAGTVANFSGTPVRTLIDTKTATAHGFGKLNGNACSSLLGKGLIRLLTVTQVHTGTSYGRPFTYRIQVAVLTDLGRQVIGV
jgi:hypothetical protein